MQKSTSIRDYDWWLLATAFAICGVGVLEIWSATHASHLAGMHTHQLEWIGLGFVLMLLLSRLDYHTIMDQAPILYLIAIIALIAVLAMGHTRFGAKRWLPILGGLLQVSELVKLIIIIVLARFFSEVRTEQLSLADLIKAAALMGLPLGLIMLQPDLGTALVLVPLAAVGAYLAGLQWKHALAILALAAIMVPVGYHFLKPYQRERVTTFLRPEDDPKRRGVSDPAIEDRRGFRRILGQGTWQRKPESIRLRAGPLFGFYSGGARGRAWVCGSLRCAAFVYVPAVAAGSERPARARSSGHVSGHGRDGSVGFPCPGECGHGDWIYAGHRNSAAVDELWRVGHIVRVFGFRAGDERPYPAFRQLSR